MVADVGSFDSFYAATVRRQVLHAYAVTGNLTEAQDCVQEAYARAWQHWRRLATYDDPEAWVRTVAWRLAADRWRNLRNARRALVRHGAPREEPEPSPDTVALVTALRRIPVVQRQAIVLHHLCEMSVEEVAAEVGAPVGTIKTRLARGRAALAELLGESAPTGGDRV
jgi:RNA polymerase sigma-70 factor (ECF subfamily)